MSTDSAPANTSSRKQSSSTQQLSLPTPRKTKTTNEVTGVVKDKNRIVNLTLLPQVLILFLRKKKGTFPKLSIITVIRKNITPTSVLGIQWKRQKTSDGLGNLHAGDCS